VSTPRHRLTSIDTTRGLIMVVMALGEPLVRWLSYR
jgi:uncharacterized membrane protein